MRRDGPPKVVHETDPDDLLADGGHIAGVLVVALEDRLEDEDDLEVDIGVGEVVGDEVDVALEGAVGLAAVDVRVVEVAVGKGRAGVGEEVVVHGLGAAPQDVAGQGAVVGLFFYLEGGEMGTGFFLSPHRIINTEK